MAKRRKRQNTGFGIGSAVIILLMLFLLTHPVLLLIPAILGCSLVAIRVSRDRHRRAIEAEHRQLQIERSWTLAPYLSMSPKEFEEALAVLCERDGCTEARVTGGAGDLGADVIATTPQRWKLVVQAKQYSPTNLVTGPDLQKFGGTCFAVHRADLAVVVTTSGFTKQARDYAAQMGIRLYDRDALAGWASRVGPAPWHT